jgi:pilus assembly protein CpaF
MELGVLQQLMDDSSVSDILINGYDKIYVVKDGIMQLWEGSFSSEEELREVIKNILKPLGRTPSETNPLIDARMPDGSRINVALPPVAIDGILVSIRKFAHHLGIKDLISYGSVTGL